MMGLNTTYVVIIRIVVPFLLFLSPIFGYIFSITIDNIDGSLGNGYGETYQVLDKILDLWFYFLALLVSLNWKNNLAKNTSAVLFFIRFIGVMIFEITRNRVYLFFFPAVFDFFFIYYLIYKKIKPEKAFGKKELALSLILTSVPKFIIEYILHIQKTSLFG